MKKYTTNNLDEAAYLVLKGHDFKLKGKSWTNTDFTFEVNKTLIKHKRAFWSNHATQVYLAQWLLVRTQLKYASRSQIIKPLKKKIDKDTINKMEYIWPESGDPYWFTTGNRVASSVFGRKNVAHTYRKAMGNCYRTKSQAQKALNEQN